ncbi:SC5A9-like protein [Mya arenaria]|uniref:SC5A9-like protein n=1 Tax=Mya arenaria TaxID=6604 RepID=A0ABY7E3L7_MYAAR|nr:sodium/glucose cotransporter 4-like [Mya arenaria]WAR03091.1 SC5A9-like protein [Mya arenaria]
MNMSESKPEIGLNHWSDILVVVVYFVSVLAVGFWSLCRPNRGSVRSYFLAGRSMTWFPVGASLFSSNIGSEHFVGLAGTGAASGIAIVLYEWLSMPLVLLLGWLFLPVYISAGVYTLPEYIQKRFGGERLRTYLSVLAIVLYIITKLAVSIFAGALFIKLALGWDMYVSIAALLLVTAVYTVLGGLAAVIYTDTLQTVIMTVGAFSLLGIGLQRVGGYYRLQALYAESVPIVRHANSTCGAPPEDAFHLLRDAVTSDQPWPGILLQASIGCLWYWCCDQVIVQRTLAAKNLTHAKGGAILAGYLKILPLFLMIWPGMISRALYPDEVGCVDAEKCKTYCDNPVGCSNIAYPKLVLGLLPAGLRGLLMAVMLSAIMSSLTSILNSASTLFTMDLWRKFRRHATERELLIVGRVFVAVVSGLSILWIPLVKSSQSGQLFVYIQAVQGYLGTPIGALFLWAILWRRMNEQGAFWGILAGHTCGVIRMVLDFVYPAPDCGDADTRPPVVARIHYTYFCQMVLVITSVVIVVVSLLTRKPQSSRIVGLTWWDRYRAEDIDVTEVQEFNLKQQAVCEEKSHEADYSEDADTTGKCKHWADFICGIPDRAEEHSMEEQATQKRDFLKESSFWSKILNVNAAIGVVMIAFLIGFFR